MATTSSEVFDADMLDAAHWAKLVGYTVAVLLIPDGNGERALEALAKVPVETHKNPETSAMCVSLCQQAIREAMEERQ